MNFLNANEKAKLKEILSKSSQLETAEKFFTNLVAVLSQVNIKDKNSESKLELVIFLEHFIELEHHLSVEDKDSLEYLIQECNKKTSPETKLESKKEISFVSDLSIKQDDYEANYYVYLEQLLASGKWQEADRETKIILFKLSDKEENKGLGVDEIRNLPCEIISNLDSLWIKYSNGHFGFSIQQEIWQKLLTPDRKLFWEFWKKNIVVEDNISGNWYRFGECVGWYKTNKSGEKDWVQYRNITFGLNAQKGHLPCCREWWKGMWYEHEPKRFFELMSKIKNCKNSKNTNN
jgi:hypothetical protein